MFKSEENKLGENNSQYFYNYVMEKIFKVLFRSKNYLVKDFWI